MVKISWTPLSSADLKRILLAAELHHQSVLPPSPSTSSYTSYFPDTLYLAEIRGIAAGC